MLPQQPPQPNLFFRPGSNRTGTAPSSGKLMPMSQAAKLINHADNKEKGWHKWKDLSLHEELFRHGIIAVKNNKLLKEVSCNNFSLNERNFSLHTHSPKESLKAQKAFQFLEKLVMAKKNITIDKKFWIANKNRRDEIFSPLTLNNEIGFYIYPWLSTADSHFTKKTPANVFKGFKKFVTAGCLFGSSLKGFDEHGKAFPLIKHDIQFYPGEKITAIILNEFAPYEDVLFHDLEKTANLINAFSREGEQKQLHYHLPYHDYILYGLELYIRGRMTCKALAELIEYIHEKKIEHINKINEVCERHQINVTIESPFENLFGDSHGCLAILQILSIPIVQDDINAELISETDRLEKEKKLVKTCLVLLETNFHNAKQAQVWKDFIKKAGRENLNTLEDLFKIANAVTLGVASSNTEKYTTCSLLPVSEKQIQCSYAKYVNNIYPSLVNFTYLDPVFTHGLGNNGLLFYCTGYETTLSELITETDILKYAQRNIIKHIENQENLLYSVKTVFELAEQMRLQASLYSNMQLSDSGAWFLQFFQAYHDQEAEIPIASPRVLKSKLLGSSHHTFFSEEPHKNVGSREFLPRTDGNNKFDFFAGTFTLDFTNESSDSSPIAHFYDEHQMAALNSNNGK